MQYSIRITEILAALDCQKINWNTQLENSLITSLCLDSRQSRPGAIFIAVSGHKLNGHDYIEDAFKHGANLVVISDSDRVASLVNRPALLVEDVTIATNRIGSLFFREPSKNLKVVGVTGTNGKSTSVWILSHLIDVLGHPVLKIGTIGIESTDRKIKFPNELTTPSVLQVQEALAAAVEGNLQYAVMEASSHGLEQGRVANVEFDAALFTNLTRDHFDYHKTFENYFASKFKLFELLKQGKKSSKIAVVNLDGDYGIQCAEGVRQLGLKLTTVGSSAQADIQIADFKQQFSGSELILNWRGRSWQIESSFIGRHNAQNLAGVFALAVGLGFEPQAVCNAIRQVPHVPGRLEPVPATDIGVYVDYAHTPDALENVAKTLRDLVKNELWIVFGCGGDRDRGKRPIMLEIACRYGDRVTVTSDNPRTEDPQAILRDICSTSSQADIVEVNREKAIFETIKRAKAGDVILIAGKGHEDYQIIGTTKYPFLDFDVAKRAILLRAREAA